MPAETGVLFSQWPLPTEASGSHPAPLCSSPGDPSAPVAQPRFKVIDRRQAFFRCVDVEALIDEDHPARPLSPYGTSKYCFEQYLGTFKRTFGLDSTVLRYANIYGPRQDFFAEEGRVIAIFASRMLAGKPVTIDWDGEYVPEAARAARSVELLRRALRCREHCATGADAA